MKKYAKDHIKDYIKDRIKLCIVLTVLILVFGMMSFLYGVDMSGVLYATLLAVFFITMIALGDFLFYKKKNIELTYMLDEFEIFQKTVSKRGREALYEEIIQRQEERLREIVLKGQMADVEMRDFYALWVHQIKTPIAALDVMLQDEWEETDPEKMQALKLSMKSELFKIERYTELVLGYLRLENLSEDLMITSCDMKSLVNQTIKKYARIFIHKNIAIELKDLEREVLTDEKWFIFGLEQILSNALKYTEKGGKIQIYTGGKDTLVIADNGIGIASEDLPRIFEKGFTGYNGRMDKKATGLGLYLTKKTMDKLGHKLQIFSDGSKGTTVQLDFSREQIKFE